MKTPETLRVTLLVGNRAYSEVLDPLILRETFDELQSSGALPGILFEEWVAEAVVKGASNMTRYKNHFVYDFVKDLISSEHNPEDCLYGELDNEEEAVNNTVIRVTWDEDN
jgi:hypothetical protein